MTDLGTKTLIDLAVPLTKDALVKLATRSASSVIYKFEKRIAKKGKGFIS